MIPIPVFGLIDTIVQRIWPDKSKEEQQIIAQQMAADDNFVKLLLAQAAINTEEAKNPNLWVSGARPGAMWICTAGFAWQFVCLPILAYINIQFGHQLVLPVFDTSSLVTMLTGMLGLGTFRTVEKIKGV